MPRSSPAIFFALALGAHAAAPEAPKNWFNDPFFQVSSDVPACPEPLGPLMTEQEALRDTHHRLERGLRCHLEKRCRYSSSYQYDPEIADGIRKAIAERRLLLPRSTLWVLVQGRRVWIYGCVPAAYRAGTLRDQLRKIPDVEVATEELRVGPRGKAGYAAR